MHINPLSIRSVLFFLYLLPGLLFGQRKNSRLGEGTAALFAADGAVAVGGGDTGHVYEPLQELLLAIPRGNRLEVRDGGGKLYMSGPVSSVMRIRIAGVLGKHTALILDKQGHTMDSIVFNVDARTQVNDGGGYKAMFDLLYRGMCVYNPDGVETIDWNGRPIRYFVSWGLDNYNTLKGMQYFSPYGNGLTNVFRLRQQPDGMIWSFIATGNADYFRTAYERYGFFQNDGNVFFVRQPTENHVEYIYVNTIYKYWKGSGDRLWMEACLPSAERALDYSVNDSLRWSARYGLLKRPLTIDSWDFQVDDEYTPQLGIGNSMLVEYHKTHFGIFFGDNTGYVQACTELAEMFERTGNLVKAEKFRSRGARIKQRLDALAWNGRFFTHFIDEDTTVHRHLGVDMRSQLAQSNAYSLNRGLPYRQDTAIIRAYMELRDRLPKGAPAEWYAIYPPFERGFGAHDAKWQYMNGGVGGHVAGELALGALDNGFEGYGVDILRRLDTLGRKYGNRIWFAYTGAFPEPPVPHYRKVSLAPFANIDLWDRGYGAKLGFPGSTGTDGNDLRGLPVGDTVLQGIPFLIADPRKNGRRSAVAVSAHPPYERRVVIPVNDTARTVYLLHDAAATGPDNVCASVSLEYADNTRYSEYILKGKQLGGWWFPALDQDNAGVAWAGPNKKSSMVGAYWAALSNPNPGKRIKSIVVEAAATDAVYSLIALSLSDQPHYVRPKPESFGGPDNWAAATAMAAFIEGLAGARDRDVAFRQPLVCPRWAAAGADSIAVTVRYAASKGYISYVYTNDTTARRLHLVVTGSAVTVGYHVLLPAGAVPRGVTISGAPVAMEIKYIGTSAYVDFDGDGALQNIFIDYDKK